MSLLSLKTDGTPWLKSLGRWIKTGRDSPGLSQIKWLTETRKDAAQTEWQEWLSYLAMISLDGRSNEKTDSGSQLFGTVCTGVNSCLWFTYRVTQDVKKSWCIYKFKMVTSAKYWFRSIWWRMLLLPYGSTQHIIGNFNKEKMVNKLQRLKPYLGDTPADSDFRTVEKENLLLGVRWCCIFWNL